MARKVISGGITGLSMRFMTDLASNGGTAKTPWFGMEPNSYADYGGQVTTVTRNPISRSRQRKKGTVTDFDASGGFNHDFTLRQLLRPLSAFFFANPFEKPTTAPLFSNAISITAVTAATGYAVDNSPDLGFLVNHLVYIEGHSEPSNNGLKKITAASATLIQTSPAPVDEAAPPAAAKITVVGYEFASGDVALRDEPAYAAIDAVDDANVNLASLGLHQGEWCFVGGDAAGNQFAGVVPFYARVSIDQAPTDDVLRFDKTTSTIVDTDGAAKTIQIFFGTFIRNMLESEIISAGDVMRHIMQLERTLGSDGVGFQSQILDDAIANSLTYTQPLSDKVSADLTFVALDEQFRSGTDGLLSGARVSALGEAAFNSSTCVFRTRMAILDPDTLNPSPLFAYVQSIELTIENNVTAVKAQGDIGGIDTVEGDFAVGGSATVYFSTVAAVDAIRGYSDVTYDTIMAQQNTGYVWDVPLLGLGNGRLEVDKDEPITVPLDIGAAENFAGFTASHTNFRYLPDAAMPAVVS